MFVVLQTGGPISSTLLKAHLRITDDASCNALNFGRITDRMICAGSPPDFKGTCDVSGS
jgi:hypothetical protein